MNWQSSSAAAGRRHAGPNLGMVATVYVLLKIASVFPVSAFGSKPPFFPGLNAPTRSSRIVFQHACARGADLRVPSIGRGNPDQRADIRATAEG